MKQELEESVQILESADEQHKKVVSFLKKLKRETTLGKTTNKISSVVKDYAKIEIQHELQTIEKLMKSSW
jgi:RNA polymerase-interacting CarD/CdnL/TRCF family regulator